MLQTVKQIIEGKTVYCIENEKEKGLSEYITQFEDEKTAKMFIHMYNIAVERYGKEIYPASGKRWWQMITVLDNKWYLTFNKVSEKTTFCVKVIIDKK